MPNGLIAFRARLCDISVVKVAPYNKAQSIGSYFPVISGNRTAYGPTISGCLFPAKKETNNKVFDMSAQYVIRSCSTWGTN